MNEIYILWSSLLSLALLIVFLFWLYMDYRNDNFRQKMFKVRDSMFDDAANKKIDFENPSYGMLRSAINSHIRFAHKLNLFQTVLFITLVEAEKDNLGETFSKRFESSLEELTSSEKEIYENYFLQVNFLIVEHLVLSSPLILITIFIPLTFILIAKKHIVEIVSGLKSSLDKIETAAIVNDELAKP